MLIDLGIAKLICGCGRLIHPPLSISTGVEVEAKEKFELPPDVTKVDEEELLSNELYDEIQAGKHDDNSAVRFKGKTHSECIATLKEEYKARRAIRVEEIRVEASKKETELKSKAKNVVKTESNTAIEIEIERFEAVMEGDGKDGKLLCPECRKELVGWGIFSSKDGVFDNG